MGYGKASAAGGDGAVVAYGVLHPENLRRF